MHIALFCRSDHSNTVQLLCSIFSEKKIDYTVYSDTFFEKELESFPPSIAAVPVGTHCFYVADDDSLISKIAGICFSAGRKKNLRMVSENDCTAPEFLHFLDTEKEFSDKEQLINDARNILLSKGIPVQSDFLGSAVEKGNRELVDLFFAAGFSPDTKNSKGVPLLCLAVRAQEWKMMTYLITSGADVNLIAEDRGYSALMDAVAERCHDAVSELLSYHADPNVYSVDGQTALILAVANKDSALVKVLLENGADPDRTDKLGMSARSYANLFHKEELIHLFANV